MSEWPLHITLADVFAVDLKNVDVWAQLADLSKADLPLTVTVGSEAALGPSTTPVRVRLVRTTPALQTLHECIVHTLTDAGAVFNTPEYTLAGFLPHITQAKNAAILKGTVLHIDTISLVDMFPCGDWQKRKVLKSLHAKRHV